jgi:nucleotide-binding universal stress UspA family protein
MSVVETGSQISLKNILFLTDFSGPSEAALPFAAAIARGYGATVYSLYVFTPPSYVYTTPDLTVAAIEAEEENAKAEMRLVESQFAGLSHEAIIEQDLGVWDAVARTLKDRSIDLIVLGTHGRTGAEKFLLGSVAEQIFRRSPVPVLTIGPGVRSSVHNGGRFRRVLFATDFTPESLAGAPYAVTLAQENQARLLLLVVMRKPDSDNEGDKRLFEMSVAEAMHRLHEIVPPDAKLEFPVQVAVEYGEPADRIVQAAKQRDADLIVIGVRAAAGRLGAATHLGRATAHKVVAHAACPVLTVRG